MEILRYSDLVEVPWKNGGGVTRDVAKVTSDEAFVWRVSRADVSQEGAFSDFSGLVRVLTVVSGSGMRLQHASGVLEARLWEPVRFDGGLKVSALLDGEPLADLNLMFDPHYCRADVRVLRGPLSQIIAVSPRSFVVLHCLSGIVPLGTTELCVGDTAIIQDSGAELRLGEGGAVLKVSLTCFDCTGSLNLVTGS